MFERFRNQLLRLLRVPSEPDVPFGSASVRVFRAAPNYYYYRLILWGLGQFGAFVGLLFGYFVYLRYLRDVDGVAGLFLRAGEILAWGVFLLQIPVSYALLRLDFEMRWYLISDRSLRIRHGTVSLLEKTMTYANVQQIAIRQNPLQRLLGISDVQVRSAGGGGQSHEKGSAKVGETLHEAWFRGVDNAEQIRTAIRERVQRHRDSGLGDPDEATSTANAGAVAAARELRDEVRALRLRLPRSSGGVSGAR
jgi:uncharacterized membrane protein YdbT with pleckstrin-like domain